MLIVLKVLIDNVVEKFYLFNGEADHVVYRKA